MFKRTKFKKPLCFTTLGMAFLLVVLPVTAQNSDVVARVNGESIQKSQLQQRARTSRLIKLSQLIAPFAQFLLTTEQGNELLHEYQEFVLQTIIEQVLLRQYAQEHHITVSSTEVSNRIDEMIRNNKEIHNRKQLSQKLEANSFSLEQLKRRIRLDVYRQKVKKSVIGPVKIDDDRIEHYYHQNRSSFRNAQGHIKPLRKVRGQIAKKLRQDKVERLWDQWLKQIQQEANIKRYPSRF